MDQAQPISRTFSLYLDLFRIVAALIVVGAHATMPAISGNRYVFPFGEDAVQAFFVLSGFVIASVVDRREASFRAFAVARLSRLWSVLIPALLIGPLLVHLAFHFWHEGFLVQYQANIFSSEVLRSIATALFSNEIWFISLTPEFNIPLWSIGFEAWYYAIFAIYTFGSKRFRWIGIGFAAAIAGPQILLLMPAWILGAFLYHYRNRISLTKPGALAAFVGGPALVLVGHAMHVAPFLQGLYLPLLGRNFVFGGIFFARDFIWQNIVGVALAIHLAGGIVLLKGERQVRTRWASVIRWAAGLSYSVYLLHFPAELVIVSKLHRWPDGPLKVAAVMVGAVAISALLGMFLEPLKTPLRKWMMRVTDRSIKEIRITAPMA